MDAAAPIPLILASQSPRRLALLQQVGLVPAAVMPADLDEAPLRRELPKPHALRLAEAKARAVAGGHEGSVVLGADTVVACGRRILPKAETEAQARHCLELLSGRSHMVHGGVCVLWQGRAHLRHVATRVSFKRLSAAELGAYLQSGEWRGKAGGYAIQGLAAAFIPSINGSYSNVVGLPLHETVQLLHGLGVLR